MTDLPDIEARMLALTTFDRNIVVTAGAGTGKTTLLVDRIIYLLMREPAPLKITDIVAITFTNKAANEMRIRLKERLQSILSSVVSGDGASQEDRLLTDIVDRYHLDRERISERARHAIRDLEKSQICTMHSFAGYVIRLYPIEAGIDPGFKEDDGSEFERHFEREWEEWLDVELSADSANRALWMAVLEHIEIESVKKLAREMCRETVPVHLREQQRLKSVAGDELLRWLEEELEKVDGLLSRHTKRVKLVQLLLEAKEVFSGILSGLSGKDIPPFRLISGPPPSGPPPSGWTEEEAREARRSIKVARRLASADNTFLDDLSGLLIPFIIRCRNHFIIGGNISFDGLLTFCRDLLKTRPVVREELKRRFKAILVDEFQDTDPLQYEIILYLSEIEGRHEADWRNIQINKGKIFIVGDPKQSIYAFRRADIEAYSRVVDMIISGQNGLSVNLSTSFRSHNRIIDLVNELFGRLIQRREMLQPDYVRLDRYPGRLATLPAHKVELRIVDGRGEKEIDAYTAARIEAEAIGKWLKEEILGRETIVEAKGNRAVVSPRHVAILLRKLTDVYHYLEVLRRYGIPYIVEGERHFYAAQEIIDFVNLLRTIDNPFDSLALAGVLRSPLGGLTDREIYELSRLSLLVYTVPEETINDRLNGQNHLKELICSLYGLLKRLNRETGVMPVPDAISYVFETLPVLEFAASLFHGEQAVANLLKLQKIAESLADRPNLTLKGFTALLETRVAGLEAEGESTLSEESVDAVRILSIHKAKGLEFPMVILAGIHSSVKGGEDRVSLLYDWSSHEIGLKVEDLRNHAFVRINEKRELRDEEELKRLLYVAMTRARECLILSGTLYGRDSRGSFLSMLNSVTGNLVGDRSLEEISIGEGRIKHSVIDPRDSMLQQYKSETRNQKSEIRRKKLEVGGGRDAEGIISVENVETLGDLWLSREKRFEHIKNRPLFISPSRLEDEMEKPFRENLKIDEETMANRDRAIVTGTLAHHILEQWDFTGDVSLLRETVEDACLKFIPPEFAGDISYFIKELTGIFDVFFASTAYDELKKAAIIGREVPFTIPWKGQIMEGVIDLLYKDRERIYIADYKTDRVKDTDIQEIVKYYAFSGNIYREAVRRCLNIEVVGFRLIFLRCGRSIDLFI